ncbi:MAG: hypothetical protein FI710_02335 [SAR202 cluster bacterium]|nr:hypothetical protein [Dehalococcoidia bacterium]MQG53838.1 hypothetical protein [SAR202 cluster bacterium]
MNWCRLKTCIKCRGGLSAVEGDWICLQCGTYYYTGLYQQPPCMNYRPPAPRTGTSGQPGGSAQKMAGVETAQLVTAPHTAAIAVSL